VNESISPRDTVSYNDVIPTRRTVKYGGVEVTFNERAATKTTG
jgi:hypothetical protein